MESQKPAKDTMGWIKRGSERLLRTSIFAVDREPHHHPELNVEVPFVVIQALDWVNVIAIDRDDPRDPAARLLWVRQYRVGSERVTIEIPGGGCSPEDTDPRASGERELLEETGARAKRWVSLGSVNPNPAIFRNQVHSFLALGCEIDPSMKLGDGSEVLEVEWRPFRDRYKDVLAGGVDHALVVAAFGLLEGKMAADAEAGRPI